MKKIGFIDFYISEWHANNYPIWIKETCEKYGFDYDVCYAWAEKEDSEFDGRNTDEWCKDFGVERCDTIAELCEKSDDIIILAPSNPEKHLKYVKEAFPCGKRFYVDKTFAPDFATAKEMYDISKKYGTSFFTTSALRYANEIQNLENVKAVSVQGGGGNLVEYIIHQAEIVVKTLGIGAKRLCAEKVGEEIAISVVYSDDRKAEMHYFPEYAFTCNVEFDDSSKEELKLQSDDYFNTLIYKILNFFETGEIDFESSETMEVMKIREAAVKANQNLGKWIEI